MSESEKYQGAACRVATSGSERQEEAQSYVRSIAHPYLET
jgi:hypothetical protein